jgi:hypothetical protein
MKFRKYKFENISRTVQALNIHVQCLVYGEMDKSSGA